MTFGAIQEDGRLDEVLVRGGLVQRGVRVYSLFSPVLLVGEEGPSGTGRNV